MDRKRLRDSDEENHDPMMSDIMNPTSGLDIKMDHHDNNNNFADDHHDANMVYGLMSSAVDPYDEDLLNSEAHLLQDLDDEDENDEGVDLFGSDMVERDYRQNDKRDQYEMVGIDDDPDFGSIDQITRQLVEAKLNRRDREIARREGKLDAAFFDDDIEDDQRPLQIRRRRRLDRELEELEGLVETGDMALPAEILQQVQGPLNEYIAMDGPRKAIQREFRHFLTSFVNEKGESVYGERIRAMCEANKESIEVSFEHLQQSKAILAYYLANSPMEVLRIFDAVAFDVVLSLFEEYDRIKPEIHVRISDLPVAESLRELRQIHLNTLVRVSGVVTRRTGVFPQLKYVKYDCVKCGAVLGPYYQDATAELKIRNCPSCQSKGPFTVNAEQTVYRNYQKLTLQEEPGSVPAGRLPRHKEVICLWDLIDAARPGEVIEVIGIYRNNFDVSLNTKNGFPVFSTILEANHISKKEDKFSSNRLTEEEIKEIRALSRDERIVEKIVKSIAPSIYGHEDIKTALALSMFSGVPKNPQGKHRIRGDINVLLLGDPGVAKSQFLKYVEKTAHRAVFATGQGASAVGLTATVHKDVITKEWTLEGGALVMADKGVCLIDEFDKMNDKDRTSIHEAMEQQSISISKAGIITTLHARCAVIAAANPIRGRYNGQLTFSQNVDLTEPILSRFDILCVVRDMADPVMDEHLSRFVANSHMRSHPRFDPNTMSDDLNTESSIPNLFDLQTNKDVIPQDLLKKYIMYAKDHVRPQIAEMDQDKVAAYYADLRRESLITGSVPITVRYLESIVRMAESFAKMHLRDVVRQDDIDRAISVMTNSFVNTQKHSIKKTLEKRLRKFLTFKEDYEELLLHVLSVLIGEHWRYQYYAHGNEAPKELEIDAEEFEIRARELGVHQVRSFYDSKSFKMSCRYDTDKRLIVKTMAH